MITGSFSAGGNAAGLATVGLSQRLVASIQRLGHVVVLQLGNSPGLHAFVIARADQDLEGRSLGLRELMQFP